jgi:hypothetical protein
VRTREVGEEEEGGVGLGGGEGEVLAGSRRASDLHAEVEVHVALARSGMYAPRRKLLPFLVA